MTGPGDGRATGSGADAAVPLDLAGPLPTGLTMVEASAGTGKTYALIALAVRWLVEAPGDGTERQPDQLLLVTFTRAAAAELRDRLRAALRTTVRALDGAVLAGEVDPEQVRHDWLRTVLDVDDDELRARRERARRMLSGFDRIQVSTLHAFSRAALVRLGLRGDLVGREPATGVSRQRDDAIRDLLLQHLTDAPELLQHANLVQKGRAPTLSTLEERLRGAVKAALTNGGTRSAADGGARLAPDATVDPPLALVWADLVREAVAELERRLDAAAELSFDALVDRLDRVLADERIGPAAASALRGRVRFALVDEMQDTDGVQWRVLTRALRDEPARLGPAADLVVVGDPKQSIYRFRGADVGVHLRVRREADVVSALLTNRRSSPRLLEALDLLLRGATFGDPDIAYVTVHPPDPEVQVPRVLDDGAPLQVRWLPRPPSLGAGAPVTAGRADAAVRADLVATVIDLLGATIEVPDPESGGTEVRPVRADDVAVLVRSHGDAEAFVTALADAGVPAVRPRAGSVMDSDATPQWRLLLAAVEVPDDPRRVRSLATSWFVDVSEADLDDVAAGEVVIARLQRRCGEWRKVLEEEGVLALLARLRTDPVTAAAMARSGERGLTDLEHVAELLHVETHGAAVPAGVLLRTLERLRLDAKELEDETDDPSMRRTSTDGGAVRVMTFHGAKGLEFPVVLLPMAVKGPQNDQPYTYTEAGVGRTVDVASWYGWRGTRGADVDVADRKLLGASAAEGDDARLLYVALTRAQARLVVWWAPRKASAASAVAQLLFAPRDPGTMALLPPEDDGPWRYAPLDLKDLTDDHVRSTLAALAAASGGTVTASAVPGEPARPGPIRLGGDADADADADAVAVLDRGPDDPTARRWSYTAFKGLARTAGPGDRDPGDRDPDDAVTAGTDDAPPVGAVDDPRGGPAAARTGLRDDDPEDDEDTGAVPSVHAHLQRLPEKGPVFGELVHGILERVDAAAPDLEAELVATADRLRARSPFPDLDLDRLARGLADAMRTPLGPSGDDPTLAAIAAADRRHEAGFLLPFADTRTPIAAARLGSAVAAVLPPDDPYRGFLADLRLTWPASRAVGWLTGSVDVVARLPDGRYAVLDHKSTTLTVPVPPVASDARPIRRHEYGAERMHRAMRRSQLPLQGLLYLVGLHRWLGRRLAGYDPARHLGDARFLFLRGMVGPGTRVRDGVRDGVLRWDPGPEAILVADAVLRGEVGG